MNGKETRGKLLPGSAKSDEAIAYFNAFMPPIEVYLRGGSMLAVKYSELDERLESWGRHVKERKPHHDGTERPSDLALCPYAGQEVAQGATG
jgi:hypothetical protein